MERGVPRAGEADVIVICAVVYIVVAVKEHLHLVDPAVEQTSYTAASGMMILADLVDIILLFNIIQVKISACGTFADIIGADISFCSVGDLYIVPA